MPLSSELQELVLERLASSESTDAGNHTWCDYVFAALQGDANLRAALDGLAPNRPPLSKARKNPHAPKHSGKAGGDATIEGPGVYVGAITVSGFRGIGPAATLTLTSGPGLTIVSGRNGSGKSSFAEGLELLLTDRNYRWDGRTKEWRDGWRNLHQARHVSLSADLIVEGKGSLTVRPDCNGPMPIRSQPLGRWHVRHRSHLRSLGSRPHHLRRRPNLRLTSAAFALQRIPCLR